eukprot:GHVS01095832.1.p1 GENE.GHVS01095832.1~~GHVS01095832.1.p1  ORF type:complete len:517 (+),score=109.96 GHVS01095832.1:37-1551(+)
MEPLRVLVFVVFLFELVTYATAQGSYRCDSTGRFPTGKAGSSPVPMKEQVPTIAPLAKYHTPPPPPPPPRVFHVPAPAKKSVQPSCVDPADFGKTLEMSAIQDCQSLKVLAERGKIDSSDDITGDKCDWLENDSCGRGDQSKKGGTGTALSRFRNRMDNGVCLVFDTAPKDGLLRLEEGDDEAEAVVSICCTPVCDEVEKPEPTEEPSADEEALLSLDEERPLPPQRPPPVPYYTPPPPLPPPPAGESCVDVKYLNFPKVENCKDLKDLAWSTQYVHATVDGAFDCQWVDDLTCDSSFPNHGAWLDGGVPDGVCLAYRDSVCGDMVGPMPVLLREERGVCQRKGRGEKKKHAQMMGVMMMPHKKGSQAGNNGSGNGGGRNGRFLMQKQQSAVSAVETGQMVEQEEIHREDRMLQPRGKKEDGLPSSTTIPICCRLQCSGTGGGRDGTGSFSAGGSYSSGYGSSSDHGGSSSSGYGSSSSSGYTGDSGPDGRQFGPGRGGYAGVG